MKYNEALIAWNPNTDQIQVGPLLQSDDYDWTESPVRYVCTGGAASSHMAKCKDGWRGVAMMLIEFHTIVVGDRVPVEAAHKAFLAIDEYRKRISSDIPGADADAGSMDGW